MDAKLKNLLRALAPVRDEYVLIGGAVSRMHFESIGFLFRKAEEALLIIDKPPSMLFCDLLWQYLRSNDYRGERYFLLGQVSGHLYRFTAPSKTITSNNCPRQIELFVRHADIFNVVCESHLIAIKTTSKPSIFAELLRHKDVYHFILNSTQEKFGLAYIPSLACQLLLTARQWLACRQLFQQGLLPELREADIYSFATDICRLLEVIDEPITAPSILYNNIQRVIPLLKSRSERDNIANFFDTSMFLFTPFRSGNLLRTLVVENACSA